MASRRTPPPQPPVATSTRAPRAKAAKTAGAAPAPKRVRASTAEPTRRRLSAADRERAIVAGATAYFAERGFRADTRELAKQLGITQPLLYRYFPTKQALIERVYREVFLQRWNPIWEEWLGDRSVPLQQRLVRFYQDYTRTIMHRDWIRLFLLSGLDSETLTRRYLKMMHARIWSRVVDEVRHETGGPSIAELPPSETEIELVWAVIASIFYIGVRRFVFGFDVPDDLDLVIEDTVTAFLQGAPAAMAAPAGGRRPAKKKLTAS